MTDFDYSLSSNSIEFLSGSANSQTVVPAKSRRVVSLPARINYLGIFSALDGVRPGSKIPYVAELGISLDTPALGSIRLPLKKEGELALPTVSATGVRGILDTIRGK